MITVIIPARNEEYLLRTVDHIYNQFYSEFEMVIVLDGPTQYPVPSGRPGLTVIEQPVSGIRPALNTAVDCAQGDYILKVDAHCAFEQGFDETLLKDIQPDEIMVARRYTLDPETWENQLRIVDYYYLSCPWTHPRPLMMQSCPWITLTSARIWKPLDDLMCFQGSMWMMSREHWDWLGGLGQDETYAEHHELSMKTWLGGRRVRINKNTWYAHPRYIQRGYKMDMEQVYRDHDHSARFWVGNHWRKRIYDFDWLIDKFWPLPTINDRHRTEKYYWPENWRGYYDRAV